MSKLTREYGEFTITFAEDKDEWVGTLTGSREVVSRSAKLSDLKKRLDKHHEVEHKFTRVPIFIRGYHDEWREGEITSVTKDGEAWVTWKDKSRSKRSRYDHSITFLLIPENLQRRREWDALEKEVEDLKKKQEDLMGAMKVFKPVKP